MTEFKELTQLHQIMCHRFYEISRDDPYSYERNVILEDVKKLEELAAKYLDAELNEHYIFVRK